MITANAHPNVKVTGRHLQVTDAINDYVTRKIEGLHLDYPKIIEAHVILEVAKYRHSAEVVLVRPGSLPKTSSGKLQRSLCKTRYLDDILESVSL